MKPEGIPINMDHVHSINVEELRQKRGIGLRIIEQAGQTKDSALIRIYDQGEGAQDVTIMDGKIELGSAKTIELLQSLLVQNKGS